MLKIINIYKFVCKEKKLMRYIEAVRNSLEYTFSNITMLLGLGLLSLVLISLFDFVKGPISSIIYTLVGTFIVGFFLKAVRDGIFHNNKMPIMNLRISFIEGIKSYLVNCVYYFVPFGIFIVILFFFHIKVPDLTGFIELFILSIIGFSSDFIIPFYKIHIVVIIFSALSTIFCAVGIARLAKSKKVMKAIDIVGTVNDMRAMGLDFIKWLITAHLVIEATFCICMYLLSISIWMMIPVYLIIFPIYNIFIYNLLGQFYKENIVVKNY